MSDLFPTLGPKVGRAGRALPRGIWNAVRFCGRGLRKLGRLLLYLLPVLVVIHLVATVITGRMLNREMARLTESGDLLTLQQVVPAVPPGEPNATNGSRSRTAKAGNSGGRTPWPRRASSIRTIARTGICCGRIVTDGCSRSPMKICAGALGNTANTSEKNNAD
jgi:hypothetical protein